MPFFVKQLINTNAAVAAEIHAVQIAAYEQEARLLEVSHFPPLDATADQVRSSQELFFGALSGREIVGLIAVSEEPRVQALTIGSLVVAPRSQRQGVGRLLLSFISTRFEASHMSVSTAAKNGPALALYAALGFVEYRREFVGPERLELVVLEKVQANPSFKRTGLWPAA